VNARGDKRELFVRLVQTPLELRPALLDELTSGAPELRAELIRLLAHDDGAEGDANSDAFVVTAARSLARSAWASPEASRGPESIAGYPVVRRLGDGGMGVVFEVEHPEAGRAALKILHPALHAGAMVERFMQEAHSLKRCAHPYVARMFDHGHADLGFGPQPYLVLELVAGEPLARATLRMTLEERMRLFRRIAEGLASIHASGVVHGDLKPGNILVRADSTPCIIDFGLARTNPDDPVTDPRSVSHWAGTLQYMSPEQLGVVRSPVDGRSDLYALGMMMYETFSGRRPYELQGHSPGGAVGVVRNASIGPLNRSSVWPWPELDRTVRRLLRQAPADRYPSAERLVADLKEIEAGGHPTREPVTLPRLHRMALETIRRRRRTLAIVVTGATFTGSAALLRLIDTDADRTEPTDGVAALVHARQLDGFGSPRLVEDLLELNTPGEFRRISVRHMRESFGFYIRSFRWPELLAHADRAIEELTGAPERDTEVKLTHAHNARMLALIRMGDHERAARSFDLMLEMNQRNGTPLSLPTLIAASLGETEVARRFLLGRIEKIRDRAADPSTPSLYGRLHGQLASIALLEGDEALYRECLALYVKDAHRWTLHAPPWSLLLSAGQPDLATRYAQDFLDSTVELYGPDANKLHSQRASAYSQLASGAWTAGDFATAAEYFRKAIHSINEGDNAKSKVRADYTQSLGVCLRDLGRLDEALPYLRESYYQYRSGTGAAYPRMADSQITLAKCLYLMGAFDEAHQLAREAHAFTSGPANAFPRKIAETGTIVALSGIELGGAAEVVRAAELLDQAHECVLADPETPEWDRAIVRIARGRLALEKGALDEARDHLEAGLRVLRATRGETYPWTQLAQRWYEACIEPADGRVGSTP
jgi:serine/threonine protein kinase/tetratricopeptide (TPR) repeat protein